MTDGQETAAGRQGIEKETDKIYQLKYFKNSLTLKQKSKTIFVKWNLKDALFGDVVLLLFPQKTRGSGFVLG